MNLEEIKKSAMAEINNTKDLKSFEEVKIKYLGRKGKLTEILKSLKDLSLEEKRRLGPEANLARKELEAVFDEKLNELKSKSNQKAKLDITKPGKKILVGHYHPLSRLEEEIKNIFTALNFSIIEGPEVETEYYNFDALNIPAGHPARDMWDTFWLKTQNAKRKAKNEGKLLLRTHTSPMQIRFMEKHQPPFQIIVPGRVFRFEATDASHEINFHQIEGLMVGKNVSLANFKFIIEEFFKKLFGDRIEFRFRPSYFPFVEPGVEVDIKLKGKWLEVMGAGMVHPKVFDYARYVPGEWQGFAFGMGLERLAMIKYNIPDIRLFYSGDLRFINQF